MELLKKNIHMSRRKAYGESRMTLSEDFNIPDKRPDAAGLIQKRGEVRLEETRTVEGQVQLSGTLEVHILYVSEGEERRLCRIRAEFPFEEKLALPGAAAGDSVDVRPELEDLKVRLINSRKFSVQALVSFEAELEELYDVQAGVELHGEASVSTRSRKITPLSLAVRKKDIVRVKEELALPSSKPNIGELLWDSVELRGVDVRIQEESLDIRGELFLFVLYEKEGEKKSREWIETSLPFQQSLECSGSGSGQIPDVEVTLSGVRLETVPDPDGEERMIQAEAVLNVNIRLYEEETVEILSDVYTPEKELIPVCREEGYESLAGRNFSKCRASDRVRMNPEAPRMLQFCHSKGEVRIDEARMTEQGIQVEGAVEVSILYVTSDDSMPFAVMEGDVPFSHLIEVEDPGEHCRFSLHAGLEQLSAAMVDSEEIEVKAGIDLNAFAAREQKGSFLTDIREKELDLARIQEMPGIVGYLVQEGDTLWDIARDCLTTPEKIREWNQLGTEEALPGTRLLILKNIPSSRS